MVAVGKVIDVNAVHPLNIEPATEVLLKKLLKSTLVSEVQSWNMLVKSMTLLALKLLKVILVQAVKPLNKFAQLAGAIILPS